MLRIFIGSDPRQPVAYNVLQHSIVRHASQPVAITPLILKQLPIERRGLTEFTFSRFLVPYLCGYEGMAVFLDADMVAKGDIAEMIDAADPDCAVSVMQDQPEFEWASAMVFSCGLCRELTPQYIETAPTGDLFTFKWANEVGNLPAEWNHFVGFADPKDAKLYHYSQGIPAWFETRGLPEDAAWDIERNLITKTVPWKDLMGKSVHAEAVLKRMIRRYQ